VSQKSAFADFVSKYVRECMKEVSTRFDLLQAPTRAGIVEQEPASQKRNFCNKIFDII
jgi:hypothetical protein